MTSLSPAPALASVRDTTRRSTDPRVARTQRKILQAVQELAAGGSRAITVADIIRRAGVGKTSFYSHFADVGELALYVFSESFAVDYNSPEPREISANDVVQHYLEHRSLYELFVAVPSGPGILASGVEILAERFRAHRSAAESVIVASSIIGILNSWLRGMIDLTPDELTAELTAMFWADSTKS